MGGHWGHNSWSAIIAHNAKPRRALVWCGVVASLQPHGVGIPHETGVQIPSGPVAPRGRRCRCSRVACRRRRSPAAAQSWRAPERPVSLSPRLSPAEGCVLPWRRPCPSLGARSWPWAPAQRGVAGRWLAPSESPLQTQIGRAAVSSFSPSLHLLAPSARARAAVGWWPAGRFAKAAICGR